jgi:hypothetical protein
MGGFCMISIKEERKLRQKYNDYYRDYFDKTAKYLGYEEICDNIYGCYNDLDDKELYYIKKKLNSKMNTMLNKDSSNISITLINIIFTFFITYMIFLYGIQVQGFYNNYNIILNNTHKIEENNTELNTINFDINKENDTALKEKLKFRKQGLIDENKMLQNEKDTLISANKTNFDSVQAVTSSVKKNVLFWLAGYAIVFIIAVYFLKVKAEKEYNDKRSFLMLCIDILIEVEEKRNQQKVKLEKEANRKELFQQIQQQIDSKNVMRDTVLPAMLEVAATMIVKKGIIKNVLDKVRRK